MYVLDASVIIKWFVEETDSKKAKSLMDAHVRGDYTLVVPDLLIYEISNVLKHNPAFSRKEVQRCVKDLYDLRLDIVAPLRDVVNVAFELAYRKKVTFYDAFYIALAQVLALKYITADKKLYDRTKSLVFVNLLSKIDLP